MKKKTFIVIWMLFIIFINSSMLIVSMVTLREQIFAEREKALAEHYVISSGLIGDMQAVKSRGGDVKASMDELMRTYSRYSQSRDNGFAVSCGKEWIWHSGERVPEDDPGRKNRRHRSVSTDVFPLLFRNTGFGTAPGFPIHWRHGRG